MTAQRCQPVAYRVRREPRSVAPGVTDMLACAYAVMPDGRERRVIHHVRHSPTGFEYGYAGSGPADLARSILIDWLEDPALTDGRGHELPYQDFKARYIASATRDDGGFEVTAGDVDAWLRQRRDGR